MKKSELNKLAKEAAFLLAQLEAVKPLYAQLDAITLKLIESEITHNALAIHGVALVDNFKDKNTVWKPSAVKRFELKKV